MILPERGAPSMPETILFRRYVAILHHAISVTFRADLLMRIQRALVQDPHWKDHVLFFECVSSFVL
jgi:hypothetical protein